ncbi:enoyl-CoA hydratase-related protein [Rhodococcus globerulus]|uniref:enoyl-CoA hydratase-related protein n=1 Tax=Rhodococcus globerulus TaxID=33008 RepID=UPI000A8C5B84|nr:enoyl-CoA hydratase-related protein [Rhodococcus globerulus]
MTDEISYSVDAGIATIVMNRPDRRNAITYTLVTGLQDALTAAAGDSGVRTIVLTGTGGNFCVGRDQSGDPTTRVVRGLSEQEDRTRLLDVSRVIPTLVQVPKPTVAVIRGGCAGAGLSLALACDLRYAGADAVFNTAFVGAGMSGDMGMAWLLTRAVGSSKARELMLLSGRIKADQAAAFGMIHEVVAGEALETRATEIARRLADSAPLALRGAKLNLESALSRPLSEYLIGEADRLITCAYSEDVEEARSAFLGKRVPHFAGR